MISSMDDAWRWYESTRELTVSMRRMAHKHWDELPWEGQLGRDHHLNHLDAHDVQRKADAVLDDIKDLCVLLLFSVFEAIVRNRVLSEVEANLVTISHVALRHAADALREDIELGSFFKILELYKSSDANLVEEVNQVRRYRNWVAHGRRGRQPPVVEPEAARDRLGRFLALLETHSVAPASEPTP